MNHARWIALVACLAAPTAAVADTCSTWDASGNWRIKQSNGPDVTLSLQQQGNTLTGTAFWVRFVGGKSVLGVRVKGSDPENHLGTLDGTIDGNHIELQIYWATDGQIGVYTGEVGPRGRVEGDTYDRQHPNSRATWFSSNLLACAPVVPPPSAQTPDAPGPPETAAPADGTVANRPGAAELQTQPEIVKRLPKVVTTKADPDGVVANRPGATSRVASDACEPGFVWREARPGDFVCVQPDARSRAAQENISAPSHVDPNGAYGPNTCMPGYVWRDAFDGDTVCVTPEARDVTRQENTDAGSHRADAGKTFRDPK